MCQNSLPSGVGRLLGAKISGGRGRPWGIFFGFYKTRYILLSNSANCTVLCGVVFTQYRRVTDRQTDRQTDGIAVASTALAMLALRHAVKTIATHYTHTALGNTEIETYLNSDISILTSQLCSNKTHDG